MTDFREVGKRAKAATVSMARVTTAQKNELLHALADLLERESAAIIEANAIDVENGKKNNMPAGLVDRLLLDTDRIKGMADGLREVAALDDPIGSMESVTVRPNGLKIGRMRVPMGVIGIIYEARPNVTTDAFGLCFKSGNVCILRSGTDARYSAEAIVKLIRQALSEQGLPEDCCQVLLDVDRESLLEFMQLKEYVDLLIPRGGAGLIRNVVENSRIPVIETGTGNCHVYVDASADLDMAVDIIFNAKTQRIGVCNACESIVIHKDVVDELMPALKKRLDEKNVEIRGDESVRKSVDGIVAAGDDDWGTEYLDYILSAKTVSSIDEAIEHINRYNTGHSESIVTSDYNNANRFLNEVDAACVYVNASTRFTDGNEFGFGAEIGISTQKLHARGPMGLKEITTTKYVIMGNGQIR
ncbi:MAG: glutamate-5-semialdehyde dehydrogenase [Eubacterium sp.]|nr:glutamate-5-semialdehyde dehydrogenase [Eubacterium sp.]